MHIFLSKFLLVCWLLGISLLNLQAQNVEVEFGKKVIALDESFTIKLLIESNSSKNNYSAFPQIPGMLKSGLSASMSTVLQNGRSVIVETVTQNYIAPKPGSYVLKPFMIKVNGAEVTSASVTVQVGPPKDPNYVFGNEVYDELLELERKRNEYTDVKADAFFALNTSKDKVYVGEGFMISLGLYIAETNKAELEFYKLEEQLADILRKIRPASCWEENYDIVEVKGSDVTINNKKYVRYTVYQAMYYPLNATPIVFPEIGLTIIKFRVKENADSLQNSKKQDLRTFYTNTRKVTVMPLPPHPLKEQVTVGKFRLKEAISKRSLETGKSFTYQIDIIGEGNLSTIEFKPGNSPAFDFFAPAIKTQQNRTGNSSSGVKSFSFQIVPKEPGLHVLRNYFEWIYFNVEKSTYDTLSSTITVQVSGESQKNTDISLKEMGPVYKNMMRESNRLRDAHEEDWIRMFANLFILGMLLATFVLFFIKR
ncbi:protein BatD [Rhodocytophaga rosea]|uniref:Protein BatD n=1 Tax=Rhodocytophaga rosea TaxID=2704465 RepID=A0A6C0GLK2_9BACT|nr:BatD family protein [Rhodocytophaga rosea]QHT68869.1 protein BatD [Rhodocytophaga rosea]